MTSTKNRASNEKGFTLAELLIVVAIIAVLVAISIPIFTTQLEKAREATDLANVRAAYAKVMAAAIVEDTSSPLYRSYDEKYSIQVPLKQAVKGWQTDMNGVVLGGVASNDEDHWRNVPEAGGSCEVYYSKGEVFINWGGENYINQESAQLFLTKEILTGIVGQDYKYSVINSNETYGQGGGTKAFMDYAKAHGFDLSDYGAATWQIYVKESGKGSSGEFLSNPAIYWSTLKLEESMVGKSVPVIGYRDGKYDVYCAQVSKYNGGTRNEYLAIKNDFANVINTGGNASFQFDNYEDAKAAYNKILAVYNEKKTLTPQDMKDFGLTDK